MEQSDLLKLTVTTLEQVNVPDAIVGSLASSGMIDRAYVGQFAQRLGVADIWEAVLNSLATN